MLVASETALACNCLPLSPEESYNNADVVFEGELIRARSLPLSSRFAYAYTFEVTKPLKGSAGTVVSIFGAGNECDARFEPGFVYRVHAKAADGTLTSGTCAGNSIVGAAPLRAFVYVQPRIDWQRGFMNTFAICGLGVLLGSGVFVWRRYLTRLT